MISKADPIYRWTVLWNVIASTFLVVLSSVLTIVGSTSIQGELALSDDKVVWLTTLYLLGINTIVPAATWFADRFGYKRMYAIGLVLFSLASLLTGFSTGFVSIAIGRLLEGIGGGFIFPTGLAIAVQNFPREKMQIALILYVGCTFGAGLALGSPIVGYLTQFESWRDLLIGLSLLSLVTLFFWQIITEETPLQKKGAFDTFGYFFFVLFIASLLVGLTYGPLRSTDAGWRSPWILGCFGVALLSLITSLWIEMHHKDPILPLQVFKDPIFSVSSAAMFLLGMSIFASLETAMEYMIVALKYEKFVSSQIGMTYGIAIGVCSILSNVLTKVFPVQALTFFGIAVLTFSYFLNNTLSFLTGPDQIFWILLLRGMGVGFALGPTTILAMRDVPVALRNQAATLLTFFRQVGGTYGGTVLAILVIKRTIFHAARFSEEVSPSIPGYQVTYDKIFSQYYSNLSNQGYLVSEAQSKARIIQNIEVQALITAQNDAMIVFGYVTLTVGLILLILTLRKWWSSWQKKSGSPPSVSKS